jgi:hypothetical protein
LPLSFPSWFSDFHTGCNPSDKKTTNQSTIFPIISFFFPCPRESSLELIWKKFTSPFSSDLKFWTHNNLASPFYQSHQGGSGVLTAELAAIVAQRW